MSISRSDPWSEVASLREAMDTLLRESFVQPRRGGTIGAFGIPLDLRETDNAYVIQAELPGVQPENVHLQVQDDTLQLSGEVKQEQQEQGQQWVLRERRYGHFQRTMTLPMPVQSDQANAEFENGILTVTLPKAPEARGKSIPIRGGERSQPIEAQSKTQQQ
ncbi:Hsp20/alpha crystallin family protein [Nitrolancea hollandica]|uniref:Heat shock protein Hsp20 n=1 Tax=Nitrolancea hollandica Lb TaxID=1129897 RepID=I4EH08_9BACT|nr:Hsp20/alpha crystallin family protein [Nitrolancea hollandica]CCF83970.1 Heat shock protein Hsp20 [Nitrolancea hollandica Lb]